jgi:two-component system LytT family response regulator
MSPEQARGRPVDARSDVFSFGALLYEMLAGRAAFERESGIETLHAVLKEPAPALPFEAPDLQRLLERCLAKEPQSRFPGAHELAEQLRVVRERLPGEPQAARSRTTSVHSEPSPRLRVLVVDDEEPARAVLREYLAARADVEVVGECRNGFEAVKAVAELRPELVFLDVQMPKLDGFEVLELIGHEVAVVFVTAFDEHALRAFEVNAVDYLLKPTTAERLATALERARQRLRAGTRLPIEAVLAEARPKDRPADRILVRDGARVHVLAAGALDYAEAQDDYVSLRSAGASFLKQQTMAELEKSLDPRRFVRIHRRYLLNVERLARLESEGDTRVAVLKDGTRLPISRAGHQRLKALL